METRHANAKKLPNEKNAYSSLYINDEKRLYLDNKKTK